MWGDRAEQQLETAIASSLTATRGRPSLAGQNPPRSGSSTAQSLGGLTRLPVSTAARDRGNVPQRGYPTPAETVPGTSALTLRLERPYHHCRSSRAAGCAPSSWLVRPVPALPAPMASGYLLCCTIGPSDRFCYNSQKRPQEADNARALGTSSAQATCHSSHDHTPPRS